MPPFVTRGRLVIERQVLARAVIEDLDVVEHRHSRAFGRGEGLVGTAPVYVEETGAACQVDGAIGRPKGGQRGRPKAAKGDGGN